MKITEDDFTDHIQVTSYNACLCKIVFRPKHMEWNRYLEDESYKTDLGQILSMFVCICRADPYGDEQDAMQRRHSSNTDGMPSERWGKWLWEACVGVFMTQSKALFKSARILQGIHDGDHISIQSTYLTKTYH